MEQTGKFAETLHYILSFLHTEGLYAAEEALLREIDNRYDEGTEVSDQTGEPSSPQEATTSQVETSVQRDDTAQRRSGSASTAGRALSNHSQQEEDGDESPSATVRLAQPVSSEFYAVRRPSSGVDYDSDFDEYDGETDPGYIKEEVRNQESFVATELYYHSEERSSYFQYYVAGSTHTTDSARDTDSREPQDTELPVVGSLNDETGFPLEGYVLDDLQDLAELDIEPRALVESESQDSEVSVGEEPGVVNPLPFAATTDLSPEVKPPDQQLHTHTNAEEDTDKDGNSFLNTLSMFGKLFGSRNDGTAGNRDPANRSMQAEDDANGDVEASFSFPVTPSSKGEPAEPVFPSWPSFKTYSVDHQESASPTERSSVAPSTSYTGSPESQRKATSSSDPLVFDWYSEQQHHSGKSGRLSQRIKMAGLHQHTESFSQNGSEAGGSQQVEDTYEMRKIDSAAKWQPALLPPNRRGSSSQAYVTYEYSEDQIERDFEILDLKVYHRKGATGFEDTKELVLHVGDLVAGRYQVVDFLGSAAFSKAVQAMDLKTGGLVCLKIVKNNKDYFDQSLDEIKLLRYVNAMDPHDSHGVLRLYEYFYYKEHLILVCELLRANLYEFQKYNRDSGDELYFTLPRIQRIARQVLRSVSFLHSLHLMHCDLKPENILIRSYSKCEVKVIDLGSSCFVSDHLSSYVQSRSYRAPEVVLGLPYNNKIDMWSLGCIFAELASGYVLFQNESVATMIARLEGILGPLPHHMLHRGRYAHRIYTRHGAIYQRSPQAGLYEVLRPKRTGLKHRVPQADELFLEFLKFLLQVDPAKRPTAEEALDHPWLHHTYADDDAAFPKSL